MRAIACGLSRAAAPLRVRSHLRARNVERSYAHGCPHNKRTVEVHAPQIKGGELRECCDVVRDGASEFGLAEVEFHERRRERFEHPERLVERRACARAIASQSSKC